MSDATRNVAVEPAEHSPECRRGWAAIEATAGPLVKGAAAWKDTRTPHFPLDVANCERCRNLSDRDTRSASDHLIDCTAARERLRDSRREYHSELVAAARAGLDAAAIAAELRTDPRYVTNAIRRHADGTCGCDADYPGDEA
jgi:hypothetical protein